MADDASDVAVLRVVVREGFSANLARALRDDLVKVLAKGRIEVLVKGRIEVAGQE